jgi:predicted  nucleic acid-binding Zn-ribbon protein
LIEHFQSLLRLQEVDGRIRTAEEEIATFEPRRVEAVQAEARGQVAIEMANAALADREAEHRRFETELSDADARVVKLDAQVYEVTSKQAMEAIQNELGAAQVRKSELEDQILELLDAIEEATAAVAECGTAATTGQSEHTADDEAMKARAAELRKELDELGVRRQEELTGLDAEMVRGYETARRRAWPALVKVETKSCPACRMVIASQKWLLIGRADSLVTCSCHRILYSEKIAGA